MCFQLIGLYIHISNEFSENSYLALGRVERVGDGPQIASQFSPLHRVHHGVSARGSLLAGGGGGVGQVEQHEFGHGGGAGGVSAARRRRRRRVVGAVLAAGAVRARAPTTVQGGRRGRVVAAPVAPRARTTRTT